MQLLLLKKLLQKRNIPAKTFEEREDTCFLQVSSLLFAMLCRPAKMDAMNDGSVRTFFVHLCLVKLFVDMETNKPIQIPESKVIAAAGAGMDEFIKVFTDAYMERVGGELTAETIPLLTGEQHVLLGYQIFRDEVMEGGFVQLIQNGYGPYIFENPFAKAMRLWGMKDFSKLVYKAREIYEPNKEALMSDCTDEEFMAKYEQYEAFDALEEIFIEEEEELTATVARYVDEHLELFAEIV